MHITSCLHRPIQNPLTSKDLLPSQLEIPSYLDTDSEHSQDPLLLYNPGEHSLNLILIVKDAHSVSNRR